MCKGKRGGVRGQEGMYKSKKGGVRAKITRKAKGIPMEKQVGERERGERDLISKGILLCSLN